MGLLELIPIARRIWPVSVGLFIAAACLLAPRQVTALIEREVEVKGREIVTMIDRVALSGFEKRHLHGKSQLHLHGR